MDKVRAALESGDISFEGPGGKITVQPDHYTTKNVYIGETRANGQFRILKSYDQVQGDPWMLKALDEKLAAMGK